LRVVARLIEQSIPLLIPGGHLILEIGTAQEQPVRALIEAHPELRAAPTIHDLRKHPRVIRAVRRKQ
ncbi:MAG: peptide chain release factor N(5)-glutamine methyltransferase, partial [Isosphaeraceae bacterium]